MPSRTESKYLQICVCFALCSSEILKGLSLQDLFIKDDSVSLFAIIFNVLNLLEGDL